MIAEAIAKIAELTDASNKVTKHDLNERQVIVADKNGYKILDKPHYPPARNIHIAALQDLAVLFARVHGASPKSAIYFNEDQIFFFFKEAPDDTAVREREDRATLGILATDRYGRLCELKEPKAYDQKALIRQLRVNFGFEADSAVINCFRSLDFQVLSRNQADVNRGRESIDKSIRATVAEPEKVISKINVLVEPFTNYGLKHISFNAVLDVDLDPASSKIVVQWLPASAEESELTIADGIRAAIINALDTAYDGNAPEIAVLYGTP